MWESTMKYFSPSFSYTACLREDRGGGIATVLVGERRSGDEDRPAADLPRVEVVQRVEGLVQGVLDRVQGDLPGLGQDHELGEIVVGADDVADDVLLPGHEVQRRGPELAAVAEHEAVAGRAGHRPRVELGALLGDEVEDHGGPAAGQVLHRGDVVAVGP